MSFGELIITLLKIVAALTIIVWVCYYWLTQGPPTRGRGRWRDVLKPRSKRRRPR